MICLASSLNNSSPSPPIFPFWRDCSLIVYAPVSSCSSVVRRWLCQSSYSARAGSLRIQRQRGFSRRYLWHYCFKDRAGISAWILYPVADDFFEEDGSTVHVYYKEKNTKLQQEVLRLTGITATVTEYTPNDATYTALGRHLYEYDPNARRPDPDDPDLPTRKRLQIHP